jgi:hypothetical protein
VGAGDGGASIASAQNGRAPQFVRNDASRVYLTTDAACSLMTLAGHDRRTHLRINGVGPATTRRRRIRFRPTAHVP